MNTHKPYGGHYLPVVEHTWPVPRLVQYYETSAKSGLNSAQVTAARGRYGTNKLSSYKEPRAWQGYLLAYINLSSVLLLLAALLSLVAYVQDPSDQHNSYLGVLPVLMIITLSTLTYYQETRARSLMQSLNSIITNKCTVIRSGNLQEVDPSDLVPGDLLRLSEGDDVPADVRLVQSHGLTVDTMAHNGNSFFSALDAQWTDDAGDVDVKEPKPGSDDVINRQVPEGMPSVWTARNMALLGYKVIEGTGTGIVIGTGDNTVMAGFAFCVSEDLFSTARHVRKSMKHLARKLIYGAGIVILAACVAWALGWVTKSSALSVLASTTMLAAIVPEVLMIIQMAALTSAAEKLHGGHVLGKRMKAVSMLGVTSVIITETSMLEDISMEGTSQALVCLRAAGIKVFAVSGDDDAKSAKAAAEKLGMMIESGTAPVVTGDELRKIAELSDRQKRAEAWDAILSHQHVVFVGITANHKQRIIAHAQRRGEVVAFIGQAASDVRAVEHADIGVAVGNPGKANLKQAADVVLLDGSFASLLAGVMQARAVHNKLCCKNWRG